MSFSFEASFGVVSGDRGTVRALGSWENEVTVMVPGIIGVVGAENVWAALAGGKGCGLHGG